MTRLCDDCEFGAEGIERGFCRKANAVFVGEKTIRNPIVRLRCQNYLVGLQMSNEMLIDWIVEKIRDFNGQYHDEDGKAVPVPGYACLLRAGSGFWFRDQVEEGKWNSVADVINLRPEVIGRWRLIATCIGIAESVQPICPRR